MEDKKLLLHFHRNSVLPAIQSMTACPFCRLEESCVVFGSVAAVASWAREIVGFQLKFLHSRGITELHRSYEPHLTQSDDITSLGANSWLQKRQTVAASFTASAHFGHVLFGEGTVSAGDCFFSRYAYVTFRYPFG